MPIPEDDRDAAATRVVAFVLPVFNEVASIGAFHLALTRATDRRKDLRYEFVYIDDGSTDSSLAHLGDIARRDPRVTAVSLSRNFGHQIAITAGLDMCQDADAVVIMDTDLQDPPSVAMRLIERWEAGAEVVYAERASRKDGAIKRATAYGFYWTLDHLSETKIPRNVGDFRLIDQRVLQEVLRYQERNRFLRGIVAQVGFRQEAVTFDRDPRHGGRTGYPLRKMLRLAADGVTGFSTVPLRLITRLGFLISLLSLIGAVYILGVKLLTPERAVPGWAFLGVGIFMLGGIQIIMMGVIGSYLGRVYTEVQQRPLYSVARVIRADVPE
ncbi:glycosyltransferase family 2 protein [Nocardioides marmoribigeumensis]|uniref:Dolichol-phosphate mannosyltransferase n=1 Tax=Nocardioides marmoribigeumensis TaxID=433649 RepID=A0ABU2BS68_9ACTN|nr:glycosyltransferase family 2 protein [Nocardioides marmoribigeumensis]MDR7360568.1 dolichol-phosphate mannosyltransferase [Nocardioides marmoribigeumensis]